MGLFTKNSPATQDDCEQRCRELRRTMQNIVIAHAAVCFRHMTPEQFEAVREDWARTVKGRGWAPFFADDTAPLPGAPIVSASETDVGAEQTCESWVDSR